MPHYVYSPVGGKANMCPYPYEEYCVNLDASNAYCDYNNIGTRPHPRVHFQSPMDIVTNWNASVHLYTSTGINSVSLVHYNNGCAGNPDVGASKYIVLHMYTGFNLGGSWVGSVTFVHVENRKAQGTYNLTDSGLGYHYLYDLGTCAPSYDVCSTVYHVHVEQDNATTGSDIQCPDTAVAAASWLFRWGS